MRSLILNFFLLILRITLDLSPDAGHKSGRFSKTLPKKSLEFVPNRGDGIVTFNLSFVLLLAEVDLILEEQSCKKNALKTYNTSYIKMIFVLLAEVVALYIGAIIEQVRVLDLKNLTLGCEICFAMFFALNKQFWDQFGSSLQVYISIHTWRVGSKSKGLSKNGSLSLKDSWKKYGSVTTLGGNVSSKLIFSIRSSVVANI